MESSRALRKKRQEGKEKEGKKKGKRGKRMDSMHQLHIFPILGAPVPSIHQVVLHEGRGMDVKNFKK